MKIMTLFIFLGCFYTNYSLAQYDITPCEKLYFEQKKNQTFENWKGNLEQVDNICIVGIKI